MNYEELARDAGIKGGQGRSDGDVAETGYLTAWFLALAAVAFVIAMAVMKA